MNEEQISVVEPVYPEELKTMISQLGVIIEIYSSLIKAMGYPPIFVTSGRSEKDKLNFQD